VDRLLLVLLDEESVASVNPSLGLTRR
jgi:hypothetical protein